VPEGHTIHRLARDQRRDLVGHPITTRVVQPRFTAGAAMLDGRVLHRVEAYGKHLFQWWDGGLVLHVHLGLFGRWRRRLTPAGDPVGEMRLRLEGPERTWDLSGATRCALVTPEDRDAVVARLGPDPLRADADPERMWERVHRSRQAIGALLMDQSVIAGIGNVYRAELLNIVGVDPRRLGRDLERSEFDALWPETVRQLRLGVRRNKIVTVRPEELSRPASRTPMHDAVYVYRRETCRRCGSPLEEWVMAARRIWRCPICQPR
jgi:endonuclease-8